MPWDMVTAEKQQPSIESLEYAGQRTLYYKGVTNKFLKTCSLIDKCLALFLYFLSKNADLHIRSAFPSGTIRQFIPHY